LSIVSMLNPGAGLAADEDCEKLKVHDSITTGTRREKRIKEFSWGNAKNSKLGIADSANRELV